MRIGIISNTDSFIPLAYTLASNKLQVSIFFSPSPDAFVNQKVEGFAQAVKIPLTTEQNKDADLYKWADTTAPDLIFMLGYKYLIDLSRIPKTKHIYNIHFGPLPSFKGPTPVFWQLKLGIPKVGLTIHQLTPKWDDGPIAWRKEVNNEPHFNYNSVNQLFGQLCVEGAIHVLRFLLAGQTPAILKDDGTAKLYHKRPALQDIKIDWQKMGAEEICNLVRACNPWNKGALCSFNNNEVKLMDAMVADGVHATKVPGSIVANGTQLIISCIENKLIGVNMLFINESYIPAYEAKFLALTEGKVFG